MENTTPISICGTNPIDILTDALAKCKERFDKAVLDNDTGRVYDCVSQMTQLSHSITEAMKAERESHVEEAIRDLTDAIDVLSEDLEYMMGDPLDDEEEFR